MAIRELSGLSPAIRWPNDVLLDGRKVAGILIETHAGSRLQAQGSRQLPRASIPEPRAAVIVGIGINVTSDPLELPEGATSLGAMSEAAPHDRAQVLATVCRELHTWYDAWQRAGFVSVREALRPLIGLGRVVHVRTSLATCEGTAADLDEIGRLVVRLDSGILRAFDAGEIALLREQGGARR
jgi:BirA family biotin operon repressor/biotin-[acetyl-CoA-carboxylase] ligase